MRNHTCLFDHRQRSHYDTITIGPEGKINWVLQMNNSQSVNTFDSLVEKSTRRVLPTSPICDRSGKLDSTEDVFVVTGETSRSHEIDKKCLHEELVSSDRSGKPDDWSENTRVKQAHDQGNLMGETAQVHTHSERTICS